MGGCKIHQRSQSLRKSGLCRQADYIVKELRHRGRNPFVNQVFVVVSPSGLQMKQPGRIPSQSLRKSGLCRREYEIQSNDIHQAYRRNPFVNQVFVVSSKKSEITINANCPSQSLRKSGLCRPFSHSKRFGHHDNIQVAIPS